ncbi:hypothetical protein [Rhizorhabdus sp.]|uniref:hypothetical protein n=1 Tax=Rhizorhabdus sp. TaxID=1968843 RepID=UPI0019C09D4B|nr:hypothetical protein [Rhizorhabdus sp.]MBD3762471.1 hypothetical protein [Rhizorhabdus sp.]
MAGGVPAGRLSIELVAEIARLQADLDKAKRAVKAASQDIANSAKAANDNLANIGKGSKLAGHHIQNLVFNFQDLGVQMVQAAQSSNPMKLAFTALMQQGSQISGVMMQAGIGVKGLIVEVGRMVGGFMMAHPILMAVAAAAGVLFGAFKLFQGEVNKSGEISAYANSLGLTQKEMKKLGDQTVTVGDGFIGLWRTINQGLGLSTLFASIKAWAADAFKTALSWVSTFAAAAYSVVMGTVRIMGTIAKAAKQALTGDLSGALTTLVEGRIGDAYADEFGKAKKAMKGFYGDWKANSIQAAKDRLKGQADKIKADRTPKSDSRAETLAREIQANEALIAGLYKVADAYAVSEAAGLKAEITAKATAAGIKKQADVEAYVAQQIRLAVAERTRDAAKDLAGIAAQTAARAKLNDQVQAGLLTSEEAATQLQNEAQLRPLIVAMDLAEGVAKAKLAAIIEKLRGAQKASNDEAIRSQDLQQAEQRKKSTDLIEKEIELTARLGERRLAALKGLRGQSLRDELEAINVEQEKAAIFLRAQAEAADLLKRGMGDAAAAVLAEARAAGRLVEVKSEIKMKEEAAERDRRRFVETAQEAGDIIGGKFGRAISQLASVLDRFAPGVSAELGKLFQELDKSLGGLLKFGGIGALAAQATGGSGLGGTIGGALGGKFGEKVLEKGMTDLFGKTLGSFAGPIGAIAGGVLGGVVGGLFKKVKKASATIEVMAGSAMQTSLTGNSAQLKKVAGALADSLIGGLVGIADQLGGMLGDGVKISIGKRKDTFRVDTAGLGRTKNMPSFDTEEEAVQYALQQAIMQGAITGLRAGTDTLIKAGGDLQTQLQKAVQFEGVFKDLAQRANPAVASLDAIAKEFDQLIDIFGEAKASAEDYAKLQELMAIKTKEALSEAFEPIRTMLDDLKSKAETAGEAVRTAYDSVLQREADAVAAYEDAISAQAEAAQAQYEMTRGLAEKAVENARTAVEEAQAAYDDAVKAARRAGVQRWVDILVTGYNEEIARLQDTISGLKDSISTMQEEASAFAQTAERLRDFSNSIFGSDATGSPVRFSAQAAAEAAQGGDLDALQKLKDAVMASAPDRATMVQQLAILKAETDKAAGAFTGKATAAQAQIAAAEAQVSAIEKQISGIEEQIEIAKAQLEALDDIKDALTVGEATERLEAAKRAADAAEKQLAAFETVAEATPNIEQLLADMQSAKAAADEARATMDKLTELHETELSFSDAVKAYEDAKVARDDLIRQITEAGFADLITVQQQTGAQLLAAYTDASNRAIQAEGSAAAAIRAAQDAQAALAAANDNNPWAAYLGNVPFFAAGGAHSGGLRIVGENGPELEATGPARYYSANRTADMVRGPSAEDIGAAVRAELKPLLYPMLKAMTKLDDRTRRWDGDGMPTERDVA